MQVKYKNLTLNIYVDETALTSNKIPVLFLHGFTGKGRDWKNIADKLGNEFLPVAIDLIGHGASDSPDEIEYYYEESQIEQLNFIIEKLKFEKEILCGYSMGGRLALSFSTKHPEKVIGLILESTTPGITDEEERKHRVDNDIMLAKRIKEYGVESFIEYWMSLPLFNSLNRLSAEQEFLLLSEREENTITGLSNSLIGFSTGKMKDHWDDAKQLTMPVLQITGSLDEKFTEINKKLYKLLPNSEHKIIPDTGHNTHLENPQDFFILVSSFLRTFRQ